MIPVPAAFELHAVIPCVARSGRHLIEQTVDTVDKVDVVDPDRVARPEEDRIRQADIVDKDTVPAVAVRQGPAAVMSEENGVQPGNALILKNESAVRVASDIDLIYVREGDGLPFIVFRIVQGEDQRSEFGRIPGGIHSQDISALQLLRDVRIKLSVGVPGAVRTVEIPVEKAAGDHLERTVSAGYITHIHTDVRASRFRDPAEDGIAVQDKFPYSPVAYDENFWRKLPWRYVDRFFEVHSSHPFQSLIGFQSTS